MFQNIQKHLLLRYPLLWNTKVIPACIAAIIFHIIFFIAGFSQGTINFQSVNEAYSISEELTIFFSVLISVFGIIIWLVYYARNNGFKAYYPKTANSVFKEWLIIFVICLLQISYTVTFLFGKDYRARSYFPYEELVERCEIISKASLFAEGPFEISDTEYFYKEGKQYEIRRNSFLFEGKQYSLKSLLNKGTVKFDIYTDEQDSLIKRDIKLLLKNNQKGEVEKLMNQFLNIAKGHDLKANIDAKKWLDLTYNAPDFTKYSIVGKKRFRHPHHYENTYQYGDDVAIAEAAVTVDDTGGTVSQIAIDTTSERLIMVNGYEQIESKYYVPFEPILFNYSKVVEAWDRPSLNLDFCLFIGYFAMFLSLALFSFRVTSGKNWLIALIVTGVTNMVIGIFTAISASEHFYFISAIFIITALLIYFFSIINGRRAKEISGITLNITLWTLPAIVPVVYFYLDRIVKESTGYYDYNVGIDRKISPAVEFIERHFVTMAWLNLLVVGLFILALSHSIKKWKGIAEG
ncbi:hypothetical protein GV828_03475 [Flavobacterium sp. NST-5]|uniref:ABC transporter permease n=1 Tax=Flavobacterium ichthyis TaxID=2698827 RepID=A0ABW9Z6I3_9FLAO|nr:hypothetical protein [Flavobacterium ichthyis]NBL64259.1 hypothetical protein [Flavobacterium ichthyis]